MTLQRRTFFAILAGSALFSWIRPSLAVLLRPAEAGLSSLESIAPYLETLIPEDESPGAISSGVPAKLLKKASLDTDYRRFLEAGARYLNYQAGLVGKPSFTALSLRQRERVVEAAESSPAGSFAWRFFVQTRFDAMRIYYANPQTWQSLSFDRPPQPAGFPDHDQPPVVGDG